VAGITSVFDDAPPLEGPAPLTADGWVAAYDLDGSPRWHVVMGSRGYEVAVAAREGRDGGVVVVGTTLVSSTAAGWPLDEELWVAAVTAAGEVEAAEIHVASGEQSPTDLAVLEDGTIAVVGTNYRSDTGDSTEARGLFVTTLENPAEVRWMRRLSSSDAPFGAPALAQGAGGRLFVAAALLSTDEGGLWLGGFDASGDLDWQLDVVGVVAGPLGVRLSSDGRGGALLSTSAVDGPFGGSDLVVIAVAGDGTLRFQAVVGSGGDERGLAAASSGDGSTVVAVGTAAPTGADHTEADLLVISLDGDDGALRTADAVAVRRVPWPHDARIIDGRVDVVGLAILYRSDGTSGTSPIRLSRWSLVPGGALEWGDGTVSPYPVAAASLGAEVRGATVEAEPVTPRRQPLEVRVMGPDEFGADLWIGGPR